MKHKLSLKKLLCGLALSAVFLSAPANITANNPVNCSIIAEAAETTPKLVSEKSGTFYIGEKCTITLENSGTSKIKWSTTNKKVASIKTNGNQVTVTAKKKGTAYVCAKVNKKTYKYKVVVKNAALSASKKSINTGASFSLSCKYVSPSSKWTVSNKNILSITKLNTNKYTVTAKKAGTAYVKVNSGGKTVKCKVTVKNVKVKKVSLSKKSLSISVGQTETLTPSITPTNATNKNVTWKSKNTKIATVSSNGTVKGIRAGTTTITVTTKDGKKTAKCTVTVTKPAATPTVISGWEKKQYTVSVGQTFTVRYNNSSISDPEYEYVIPEYHIYKNGVLVDMITGEFDGMPYIQEVFSDMRGDGFYVTYKALTPTSYVLCQDDEAVYYATNALTSSENKLMLAFEENGMKRTEIIIK